MDIREEIPVKSFMVAVYACWIERNFVRGPGHEFLKININNNG